MLTGNPLSRLLAATDRLRAHHDALREQNDGVAQTGLRMEETLRPLENGIRIEREREEREAVRIELVAADAAAAGEEQDPDGAIEDVRAV